MVDTKTRFPPYVDKPHSVLITIIYLVSLHPAVREKNPLPSHKRVYHGMVYLICVKITNSITLVCGREREGGRGARGAFSRKSECVQGCAV